MTLRALDLFCCAGGASMGLRRAGFEVVGVDIRPQPHYPFEFHQADALTFPLDGFDFIWASPPCQRYSEATPLASRASHPDLIDPMRQRLVRHGVPWVIENVDGARHMLREPFYLCGTMFGLNVWRHRWFEFGAGQVTPLVPSCRHEGHPVVISGSAHGRGEAKVPEMIAALGVPWMKVRKEVRQAIPPAYAEFIGRAAIAHIESERTAA